MTLLFDEALHAPDPADRFQRLRIIGDGILYGCGFFGDHFEARGVDAKYLRGLGTRAYGEAGAMLRRAPGDGPAVRGPDLFAELAENFDYQCCETIEEFSRLPRALMRSGQIKSNERRHEKDDRHPIGDRSRFVLGWDNQAKLKVLRGEQAELRRRLVAINADRERLKQQQREHDRKLRAAETLLELKEFSRIDWRGTAAAIQPGPAHGAAGEVAPVDVRVRRCGQPPADARDDERHNSFRSHEREHTGTCPEDVAAAALEFAHPIRVMLADRSWLTLDGQTGSGCVGNGDVSHMVEGSCQWQPWWRSRCSQWSVRSTACRP